MLIDFSCYPPEGGIKSYRAEDIVGIQLNRIEEPVIAAMRKNREYPYYEIVLEVLIGSELRSHLVGVHDTHAEAYRAQRKSLARINEALKKQQWREIDVRPLRSEDDS